MAPLDRDQWRDSKDYLFGLDLFNSQFYWEAHEQLEGLWLAAGRHGSSADFLKGLIKLAAAGVKHREGKPAGVQSHACRAAELFRATVEHAREGVFAGLEVTGLVDLAEGLCQAGWPETLPVILPVNV